MPDALDYRLLFEAMPGKRLVLDPDFVIVAASDSYLGVAMRSRADLVGRNVFDAFPDDASDTDATGAANLRDSLERVRDSRVSDSMAVQKYSIQNPAKTGGFEVRFWSPTNSPVLGPDGRLLYILHRVEDVTDYVRGVEEGEDTLDDTSELRPTDGGKMGAEVFRRAQHIQTVNRALRSLQGEMEERVQARTQELERAHAALHVSEEQFRQAQKMEAIGRLAGGIAHDFNNLLTVIVSYADLLRNGVHRRDQLAEDLDEIKHAALRAADLTRQLLVFSRKQVLEPCLLNVGDVLGGITKMLGRVLGEDIELTLAVSPELLRVHADRSQMEQVIVNIVVNARDAMMQGGCLILEASNVVLDESYARDHLEVVPGRYVMLAFSDTGHGMDKSTLDRIFEPFFTTKEEGRGTGLGLSTVFGIVKQSGGHILVYSEVGLGTTFKIYLPEANVDAKADAVLPEPPAAAHGTETVMVVEDESSLRAVAVSILQHAGFHVLEASGPVEALRVALHDLEKIDLVLSDVVMPTMNGRELIDRLRVVRPSLKAMLMSGYTDQVVLHHGELAAGVSFIQKPFTPDSLTRRVRQALDGQT